jgi:hypothetical protein
MAADFTVVATDRRQHPPSPCSRRRALNNWASLLGKVSTSTLLLSHRSDVLLSQVFRVPIRASHLVAHNLGLGLVLIFLEYE